MVGEFEVGVEGVLWLEISGRDESVHGIIGLLDY